ncbi:pentapeptide repeat-containing protein [Aquimarina sp. ERC-38]|uniref:pentapeptide repeat-containing protein n=1 Tax=Aquimarina sp. ERC-38 TaxID=2949996 RepID=UPI00224809E6|nr:pentapeptide repeat-containing protein [Aquimarina sp. ERC-38]UZO81079.1 pentapeptide repeat-containing protein [Aquimarina sp. ERC-38]
MSEQEYIQQLEAEKEQLQKRLNKLQAKKEKRKGFWAWLLRKSSTPLLGVKLKDSIQKAIQEYKVKKSVSVDTVSEVSSNVIWRITRIGIFSIILAIIPSLILITQTWLVMNQNELVSNQNQLIAAERKSSLVFVMDNLLSDLSDELKYKPTDRNISPVLESRFAGLSRAMKPYADENNEEQGLISNEKGQLLYSLVQSNLGKQSLADILNNSDFDYTYFKDVYVGRGAYLKYAKLNHAVFSGAQLAAANLEGSELKEARLHKVNLSDANLKKADFSRAVLTNAELMSADLTFANLSGADLTNADLSESILWKSNLMHANLTNVKLDNAIVDRKDWLRVLSDSLEVKGADRLIDLYKVKKQTEKQYILKLK